MLEDAVVAQRLPLRVQARPVFYAWQMAAPFMPPIPHTPLPPWYVEGMPNPVPFGGLLAVVPRDAGK